MGGLPLERGFREQKSVYIHYLICPESLFQWEMLTDLGKEKNSQLFLRRVNLSLSIWVSLKHVNSLSRNPT